MNSNILALSFWFFFISHFFFFRVLDLKDKIQRAEYNGGDKENIEEDEGRLPTPELKQESPDRARRHHLDLTTPSIGGALLTCPAPKGSKLIITSRSGELDHVFNQKGNN